MPAPDGEHQASLSRARTPETLADRSETARCTPTHSILPGWQHVPGLDGSRATETRVGRVARFRSTRQRRRSRRSVASAGEHPHRRKRNPRRAKLDATESWRRHTAPPDRRSASTRNPPATSPEEAESQTVERMQPPSRSARKHRPRRTRGRQDASTEYAQPGSRGPPHSLHRAPAVPTGVTRE